MNMNMNKDRIPRTYSERINDNQFKGLVVELINAIEDCEDPEMLRKMSTTLRDIGSIARNMSIEFK